MNKIKIHIMQLMVMSMVASAVFTSNLEAGKNTLLADSPVIPVSTHPWYWGMGMTSVVVRVDRNTCHYGSRTYGFLMRGGYDFNENFGLEARWLRSYFDGSVLGGVPLEHVGLYAKPQVSLGGQTRLYGLMGFGYTKNLASNNRRKYIKNGLGFSAGAGIEYSLEENARADGEGWALFLDYQRLFTQTDLTKGAKKGSTSRAHIISAGIKYHF
jgi:opacity protein-like surface antigen